MKRALFLWLFVSIGIAVFIDDAFFSNPDDRLQLIFVTSAAMATAYAHNLFYRREELRSLRNELLSWGIVVVGFGGGIWISFAYLDGDSFLGHLPIVVGIFVACGVELIVRKRFREA